MSNLLFLAAFIALPVISYVRTRNLTWTVAITAGTFAVGGAFVSFWVERGNLWNLQSLQWALLVLMVAGTTLSLVLGNKSQAYSFRRHLYAGFLPVVLVLLVVVVSRLIAAPSAGLFTGVGFLIQRQHAEDNAQWLDYSSQLIQGNDIVQAVPIGGPLQLFMVFTATLLASVSFIAFGGVNEVFVASNSVIYGAFGLAALAPFALAPLVEMRRRVVKGASPMFLPAPVVWAGMLVLVTASLAVSGLGHLTFQFVFISLTFWVAIFAVGSRARHGWAIASLIAVGAAIVWFPLTPIAVLVLVGGLIVLLGRIIRQRSTSTIVFAAVWIAMIVMTWQGFVSATRYITDTTTTATGVVSGIGSGIGGGIAAVARQITTLDLLASQGGTEQVSPSLSIAVVIAAVLAVLFIRRVFPGASSTSLFLRFSPAIVLVVYSLGLLIGGSWWSGQPPAYGALKSAFLVSIVVLAVAAPLAIMELDPRNRGRSVIRFAGIAGIIYVLSIDGLLTRAVISTSPTQWPNASNREGNYWWPAEVVSTADQPLNKNPIGCAYFPQGAIVPTALPDGQRAYACTRLLTGLAGIDTGGQPIINWLKREWFTNTGAWDPEYPGLLTLTPEIRQRQLILMDELNNVVGLESVGTFMERQKPQWAIDSGQ
jgi:hypothetical protein